MAAITYDENYPEIVDQTYTDVSLQSQYGTSDETKAPTQVIYRKGQVHMETQTYSSPDFKSSAVLNRQYRTRTQRDTNLSSNVNVKVVDNLVDADSGDDPS
ncbi:hypothetical protein ACJMK2_022188 [Sinanodonta woodiana]|uniref:Uncharacterized protein n=1 Tax=Sinanodonta woodiana TaxID=1069815 RepID=A0ABD3TJL3_SINWO